MKKQLITLLALSWTMLAPAQTANTYIAQGTNDLTQQTPLGLWNANTNFAYAVALSPANETANALWAVTRLLVLPQTPAGSNFLNQIGMTNGSRNVYGWTATLHYDINGDPVFPANYNSTNIIAFFRTNIMAVIAASATNLAGITDSGYTLPLSSTETSIENVTVDYGDILMLRALLAAGQFAGYTLNANNCGVILPQVEAAMQTNGLTYQWLLATYPNLLSLAGAGDLAASKGALTNAIALYFAASDFIRNARSPGSTNNLFSLSANDYPKEAQFRADLTNVLLSLAAPTEFNPNNVDSTIYGGAYFAGTHSPRSLMPKFTGDTYVNNTLPDYTFGGIFPYQPAYKTESLLRKEFYSYAGIYGGSISDFTFNDPIAGNFSVFISTNQLATVVGYDADSANSDYYAQSGGIFVQFTIGHHGNWQFESNNVSGYGWVDKGGSFGGELDFTNGDSVELYNGYELSAQGSFQNAAGFYSGTASVGTLSAVLTANGQLIFREADNSDIYTDGGEGQLGSNNYFTTVSVGGTTVSGTLNNSTFQITGNFISSDGGGSFSLSRSAKVPFDVPPVIKTNLPLNISLPLGTNATFFLVATGSPPMCFQWYGKDNVLIPSATTNKLVVSNLQYSAAGTYSVTINNVAGETNASVTLTVTAETVPPVISITNATAGMVVSNSPFTVRGWATDNVAVASVYCAVSNSAGASPWMLASTANQWTNWYEPLNLVPGTNTLRAYAVDTSGNLSTTNTVNLDYVVSAVLTVRTNGLGSISPNDNGAPLQVGNKYLLTATPGSGFSFTNWIGGTNGTLMVLTNGPALQFVMQSNLVLQVNFLDVTKPMLTITAPAAGQHMTNALVTVAGAASDNWKVAGVWYQLTNAILTGGTWNPVTTTNGYTNWTTIVTLATGTNTVKAYAMDLGGNTSTIASVSFMSSNSFKLQLAFAAGQPLSSNGLNFILQVSTNLSGHIQVSTNLEDWTTLTNFLGTNTTLNFRDAAATNYNDRYYRAVIP